MIIAIAMMLFPPLTAANQLPNWFKVAETEIENNLSRGELESAKDKAEAVLRLARQRHGPESRETAFAMLLLAMTLSEMFENDKALPLEIHSLEILERLKGKDDLDIAIALISLAQTYSSLAEYEKALKILIRTLEIREKSLGLEHPDTRAALHNLGSVHNALGSHESALSLQLRALEIEEKVVGLNHPDTALALNNLAMTHSDLAQHEKALPLLARSLTIRESTLGPDHPDTATSLNNLALTYGDLGQFDKALPLQLRSLYIREKFLGLEDPRTSTALNNLAMTYRELAQYEKALPLQYRTLAINEKVRGPEHPDTAIALTNLSLTYNDLSKHAEALPLQLRALSILEQTFGPEHAKTAIALNNLAVSYGYLAQHDKAKILQLRALAILEKALDSDHPDIAIALDNLSITYNRLAQFDKSLPLQHRSLAIREKVQGSEHPHTGLALNNLASTYGYLAQYDNALPLQLRFLAIQEAVFGEDHPDTSIALNNLALTYGYLGQRDKALLLELRALTIMERVFGTDDPSTATALGNIALTYSALAQYEKALPLQLRALEIEEKAQGPEHPDTAWALGNLASTYRRQKNYDKALSLQMRALAIQEGLQGPEHPGTANVLKELGLTYGELSQHEKALPFQLRSLAIFEKVYGPEHPGTAIALNNLALTYISTGHHELALVLLKTAVNIYQATRERVSQIGAPELRSYTESVSQTYQRLAEVLTDQGRLSEAQMVLDMLKEDEQFDFIRRAGDADPRRTRIGYTPTEQKWIGRYREIADRLAALGKEEQALQKQSKLGLSEGQKKRQAALAADLKVAQAAFESFLEQMRHEFVARGPARSVEFVESSVKALAELQELLKVLGDDVALLRIYLTDEQVNFLLTTPGVQLARNVKIKTQDLNRQVAELNRLLRDPKSDPMPAAQTLYKLLLAPVEQDLQQAGAKTVMLSLDGVLRYLPFGALHDGHRYALQRWNLPVYTSVVRDRLRDAANANWQAAGLGVTRKHGNFDPLPAVRAEMSSIIRTGATGVLPGEVYLDEAFTATRLKDVSQRQFPVVHVASHFQFSPGTEINSFLLLGDGSQLTLGDIRTQNYRFDNVDLLTLSACDTGLGGGRDEKGREIEGFGVIAQQQGAKAVLATLWPVADQSTAALMADMYRKHQDSRLSKIEALRQAQMTLQAQPRYSHPYFWAPFILMGNWK
jgi:CHAT domain-containing protein